MGSALNLSATQMRGDVGSPKRPRARAPEFKPCSENAKRQRGTFVTGRLLQKRRLVRALIYLGTCLALVATLGGMLVEVRAGPVVPLAQTESIAIVDVHNHLNGDMSAEELIGLMDKNGVSRMVLMPRYFSGRRAGGSGSDEQALAYAKEYPGRFIPFVAGQRDILDERERWLNPDEEAQNFLREVETKLRTQSFYGIGELIIRHYPFEDRAGGGRERDIPVNTPLMQRLADLAARHHVPLLIHAEGEPDVVVGMRQLLENNPAARIIWAHNCGRSSADIIRGMLARYPNLFCDLGGMLNGRFSPYGGYWPKKTPWMFLIEDGRGQLLPEMKELYEAFPKRFFLGTDHAFTRSLRNFSRRIHRFRQLLSGLTPETARRLASGNADEMFRVRAGPAPTGGVTNGPLPGEAAAVDPDALPPPVRDLLRRLIASGYKAQTNVDGRSRKEPHKGVDIRGAVGDDVLAAADGRVTFAGDTPRGLAIFIAHDKNLDGFHYFTTYYHNTDHIVKKGDMVTRGQVIAHLGDSGSKFVPHVHFGVNKSLNRRWRREQDTDVNPDLYWNTDKICFDSKHDYPAMPLRFTLPVRCPQ